MDYEKKVERNINITKRQYNNNLSAPKEDLKKKLNDAKKKAGDLLKMFDLGGKPITLRFKGEESFKSPMGGIISIFTLSAMFLYIFAALISFLGRQSPTYSTTSQYDSVPSAILLEKLIMTHDLIAGISVSPNPNSEDNNSTNLLKDPSSINYTISYVMRIEDRPPIEIPATIVNCSMSSSFMKNQSNGKTFYDLYNLNDAICFKLDNFNNTGLDAPVELSGNEFTDVENKISIKIAPCKNSAFSQVICKNNSDIKKIIDGAVVNYFFNHKTFRINDTADSPINNSTGSYKFNIQSYFNKKIDIFVQNNTVMDYYDLIKEPSPQYIFTYSSTNFDVDFISSESFGKYSFIELYIKVDSNSSKYVRKFTNLKEFFIGIAGIVNGILLGGKGFASFINGMLMKISLINKSFYLEQDEAKSLSDNKSKMTNNIELVSKLKVEDKSEMKKLPANELDRMDVSSREFIKNLKQREDAGSEANSEDGEKKDLYEKKIDGRNFLNPWHNSKKMMLQVKAKKYDKFDMSISELIMQMLPCFSKNKSLMNKKKILNDCSLQIEEFFDIERIIGILREYQDLRTIVLNEEEYKILKQLSTPIIELKNEEVIIKKIEKMNINEKELKEMYLNFAYSINKLIKSPYLSGIEYNLLDLHRLGIEYHENMEILKKQADENKK